MTNYDKIKDLIEKKKLSQGLLLALSNSLKIKLVTKTKGKEQVNNIETEIDLVKGLTTEINDKSLLSQNNYTLNFHQKQLENIYDTWDKNRETLVKIFQIINGSSIKLGTSEYLPEELTESDDSFAHEFDDFESESSPENSLFEEESLAENPLNEEENNNNIDDETQENWIDDLDNDNEIEDSFPQEEDEENTSEDDSFEMMMEEEDIFTSDDDVMVSKTEFVEESIEEDEDWDDFMVEMPEEEAVVSEVIASDDEEISSDVDMDDDWEEWLDEDNLPPPNNEEYTPDTIDWSEEN